MLLPQYYKTDRDSFYGQLEWRIKLAAQFQSSYIGVTPLVTQPYLAFCATAGWNKNALNVITTSIDTVLQETAMKDYIDINNSQCPTSASHR